MKPLAANREITNLLNAVDFTRQQLNESPLNSDQVNTQIRELATAHNNATENIDELYEGFNEYDANEEDPSERAQNANYKVNQLRAAFIVLAYGKVESISKRTQNEILKAYDELYN